MARVLVGAARPNLRPPGKGSLNHVRKLVGRSFRRAAGAGLVGPGDTFFTGTGSNVTLGGTVSAVGSSPVPEPSTCAGVFGLLALGYVCVNRRLGQA